MASLAFCWWLIFQSTLSVRRATAPPPAGFTASSFQSTLSVRRATSPTGVLVVGLDISIHALREESDPFHLKI